MNRPPFVNDEGRTFATPAEAVTRPKGEGTLYYLHEDGFCYTVQALLIDNGAAALFMRDHPGMGALVTIDGFVVIVDTADNGENPDRLYDTVKCPNCGERIAHHSDNGCILNTLIGVLRDREENTPEELRERFENCDPDHLWNDLGPIVDKLQAGGYD